MIAVPEGQDTADAHQPHEQEPGDFLGPGNRPMQEVPPDDLQSDDGGLRRPRGRRPPTGARGPRETRRPVRMSRANRLEPRCDAEPLRFCFPELFGAAPKAGRIDLADRHPTRRQLGLGVASSCDPWRADVVPPRSRPVRSARAARQAGVRARRLMPTGRARRRCDGASHMARDFIEALLQGRARVVFVAVDDAGLE